MSDFDCFILPALLGDSGGDSEENRGELELNLGDTDIAGDRAWEDGEDEARGDDRFDVWPRGEVGFLGDTTLGDIGIGMDLLVGDFGDFGELGAGSESAVGLDLFLGGKLSLGISTGLKSTLTSTPEKVAEKVSIIV